MERILAVMLAMLLAAAGEAESPTDPSVGEKKLVIPTEQAVPDAVEEDASVEIPDPESVPDEITVRVVDASGTPVANLGVYVDPQPYGAQNLAGSSAFTNWDGIAVVQRARSYKPPYNQILLGLSDRNRSDVLMASWNTTIPDSVETVREFVWPYESPADYAAAAENRVCVTVTDQDGAPLPNYWVHPMPTQEEREAPAPGEKTNPGIGTEEQQLYDSRWQITNQDGKVVFVGLPAGRFVLNIYGGRAPFNLVATDHPLLQVKMIYPDNHPKIQVEGQGSEEFTVEFRPS
ncbi:MAG: hypothetical protein KH009_01590 [Clostridiales bacterium]|nr:hypothetical protein [Clostridiales bacterium]